MCTLFFGVGGLRKCMVCTLVKMLTFMDGPLLDTCISDKDSSNKSSWLYVYHIYLCIWLCFGLTWLSTLLAGLSDVYNHWIEVGEEDLKKIKDSIIGHNHHDGEHPHHHGNTDNHEMTEQQHKGKSNLSIYGNSNHMDNPIVSYAPDYSDYTTANYVSPKREKRLYPKQPHFPTTTPPPEIFPSHSSQNQKTKPVQSHMSSKLNSPYGSNVSFVTHQTGNSSAYEHQWRPDSLPDDSSHTTLTADAQIEGPILVGENYMGYNEDVEPTLYAEIDRSKTKSSGSPVFVVDSTIAPANKSGSILKGGRPIYNYNGVTTVNVK